VVVVKKEGDHYQGMVILVIPTDESYDKAILKK